MKWLAQNKQMQNEPPSRTPLTFVLRINQRHCFVSTVLLFLMVFCSLASQAESPQRTIEEKPLPLIDTGLEPRSCCSSFPTLDTVGYWLDDNLFLTDALREVPDANQKQLERVMLFDIRTKKAMQLVAEGALSCWSREYRIAGVKDQHNQYPPKRFYRFDAEGKMQEITDNINPVEREACTHQNFPKLSGNLGQYLSERDGYLQISKLGGRYDPKALAVLVRPNKEPLTLPVIVEEIDWVQYLEFMDKYLLNHWDSQQSSMTNRRMNTTQYWGDRPYDLTPYRLMAPDGKIEEIPYPKILFEYGLKYFAELKPTKAGLLINNSGRGLGEHGLFLLKDERLILFWGKPQPRLFAESKSEMAANAVLSPNGCRIAFFRFANTRRDTPKYISIIDLCQEN